MKFFTALLALCIASQISAQAVLNPYDGFTIGEYYYLLADAVNLRTQPDTKSDLVCKIPIGTEIKILEKSTETLLLNGIRAPWYKIAFYESGMAKSGYIWGGFIALLQVKSKEEPALCFLIGQESVFTSNEKSSIVYQIRVCKEGKELLKTTDGLIFPYEIPVNSQIESCFGIKTVKNILFVDFAEAGVPIYITKVLFWDSEKLHTVLSYKSVHRRGGAIISNQLVCPENEGGKAGNILHHNSVQHFNPSNNKYELNSETITHYIWKDGKLQQVEK